ncbi:hypothetical protein YC2023_035666 [Brassica napus]
MTKTKPFNTVFTKPTPVTCCCCDCQREAKWISRNFRSRRMWSYVVRKVVGWLKSRSTIHHWSLELQENIHGGRSYEFYKLEVSQPVQLRVSAFRRGFKPNHEAAFSRLKHGLQEENQDAINFLNPAKPTSIWESFQPTRFGLTQAYPWKPEDTLDHAEDTQDVHRCTSTQRIRRILLTIYFPYPATPYAFKESCLHLMSKDQRLYSFEPEETKILKSLIISQRLLFRGYFSKISRYKISLLQRQQISLTASSHGAIKAIDSKHFISIYFLSLVHFQTVRESLVEPIKL